MKHVLWFATHKCALGCPYCWQHGINGKLLPGEKGDGDKWLAAWRRLKPELMDVTGGEPLDVPWLFPMLAQLDCTIAVTTSLVRGCHQLTLVPPERYCVITCSWHPLGRLQTLESFSARVKMLKERGYRVNVNYVTYPEQVWETRRYRDHFHALGVGFHADKYSGAYPYTERERREESSLIGPDRAPHPLASLPVVECDAGLSHCMVMPDGNIWRCLKDQLDGLEPLGNILEETYSEPTTPVLCTRLNVCPGCDRDKVSVKMVPGQTVPTRA